MNNIKITRIPWPVGRARVETGPLQFGDDWPGTFMRGDHSLFFYFALCELLSQYTFPELQQKQLEGLRDTLGECNVISENEA
jgi:hypothetical protein